MTPLLGACTDVLCSEICKCSFCSWIMLVLQNLLPFRDNLDIQKRKALHGARSGEYGGYRITVMTLLDRSSYKGKVLWTRAVLWQRNQSPMCHFSDHFHCTLSGRHHRMSAQKCWCTGFRVCPCGTNLC
jgi:hypothetical protein